MAERQIKHAEEILVKGERITREELESAREHESRTGSPWYMKLLEAGKISFSAVEEVLRYEFHPKALRSQHESLGRQLLEHGYITQAQLNEALKEQNRTGRLLGNILLDKGFVTHEQIARVLAKQYNIPYIRADEAPSDPEVLEIIPEHLARRYNAIPVRLEEDRLTVLITEPQAKEKLAELGILLGMRVHAYMTGLPDIQQEIRRRYDQARAAQEVEKDSDGDNSEKKSQDSVREISVAVAAAAGVGTTRVEEMRKGKQDMVEPVPRDTRFDALANASTSGSVVSMVERILEGAINAGATDIHLDPQEHETRVRYRIDGDLHDVMSMPPNVAAAAVSRVKVMAEMDITNTRLPQDGHLRYPYNGRTYDVRVATLPTALGERLVMRILDQTSVVAGIKDLGLQPQDERTFLRLIDQPYGMILVTGPTGSGKTTTLYAALSKKNVITDSIVTLEDPVEYRIPGINQVQIDPDIGLTFAGALRAALRQDIDVILVGEIRDQETAQSAVRAAMTGHLVFSTLHTNDAVEALSTLQNMGVPAYLLSSALTGVIGQRLVRKICPECKTPFKPSRDLLKSLGLPVTIKQLWRGKGCAHCFHRGCRGRTGVFEILEITEHVRPLIGAQASAETIVQASRMSSMADDCRAKVRAGIIPPEEYLQVVRT